MRCSAPAPAARRGAPMAALLERMLDLEVPVVAVDGPTGVDLATGIVHGAPRADLTVTFGGLRRGHLLARDEVGDARRGRHRPSAGRSGVARAGRPTAGRRWLRRLGAADHKGDRGRVVVVGGDAGMTGAARMAGRAAFAAGAGLVHVVAPPRSVAALVQAEPDLQTLAHALDQPPIQALLELVAPADARRDRPRASGASRGAAHWWRRWSRAARAVVLDADALVAFQGAVGRAPRARCRARRWCSLRIPASSARSFPTSRPSASSIPGPRPRLRRSASVRRAAQGRAHGDRRARAGRRSRSPRATRDSPPAAAATC